MDKQPTILITGVNGQVGYELLRSMQGLGRVVGLDRAALDLTDLDRVREFVRKAKPALIVNPAAYTAVDKAETDEAAARRLNAEVPAVLAEEAARCRATLIHYSTDYVFDGTKDAPYLEDDPVNPQNVYGQTKLEGEQAIAASDCAHLILRTSWVYGRRGKNFLLTMLRLGAEKPELRVVSDQIGAPTWSNTIATLTAHIAAQGLAAGDEQWWHARSGIYHLSAAGETTWYGFAKAIFEMDKPTASASVVPISSDQYPVPALRPANSRMSQRKLSNVFGLDVPDWHDALQLCMSR